MKFNPIQKALTGIALPMIISFTAVMANDPGSSPSISPDVEDAWATTYQTLSSVMIEGADYGAPTLPVTTKQPWWRSLKEMWAT